MHAFVDLRILRMGWFPSQPGDYPCGGGLLSPQY